MTTLEYILSLKDKFSAVSDKFSAAMEAASAVTDKVNVASSKLTNSVASGWIKVTDKVKSVIAGSRQLSSSIEQLKSKLSIVQAGMQKTTDKNAFRYYYNEAKRLELQIRRLEQGITGKGLFSKLKGWGKDFISAMPGGAALTNPITALAAGVAKLQSFLKESKQAYIEEAEQITKLKQVMSNTMGARNQEIESVQNLMKVQQDLGVINTSVQSAGSQELATYLTKADSLKKLIPVMNDMLAQQYGMNASQEQAINIASMMGKVMDGQVGALSRYGYKFSETQEKILKTGTEAQRAATLAEVIGESVGGVNEALAKTPEGKLKKVGDRFDMIKVRVGELITKIQTSFSGGLEKAMSFIDKIVSKIEKHQDKIQMFAQIVSKTLEKVMSGLEWVVTKVYNQISAFWQRLREGNPLVLTITGIISSLIAALIVYYSWMGLVKLATGAWTMAQGILNAVLMINPVVLIIAGIIALITLIGYLIYKIDGWGAAWDHTVNGAKKLWETYVNYVKSQFTLMVEGIMIGIDKIKLGWYKFKEAVGLGDSSANQQMISDLNESVENRKKAIEDAYKKVGQSAAEAVNEFKSAAGSLSWNDKSLGDLKDGLLAKFGIKAPGGIPGVNADGNGNGTNEDNANAKNEAAKTNEAIATGGTKHNYITIHLREMIGIRHYNGSKDAASQKAGEEILDSLLRLTASATTAVG